MAIVIVLVVVVVVVVVVTVVVVAVVVVVLLLLLVLPPPPYLSLSSLRPPLILPEASNDAISLPTPLLVIPFLPSESRSRLPTASSD